MDVPQAPQSFPLRGLSIGEIFDRAVTIYVRNALTLSAIVLAFQVPIAAFEYVALPHEDLTETLGPMLHAHANAPPPLPFTPQQLAVIFLIAGAALLLLPFANNAVAVCVANLYSGKRPSFSGSYALVVRRWAALIGTSLLEVGIFVAAYLASVMALLIPMTVGILLVRSALPLAIGFFVLTVAGFVAMLLLFVMLFIAYSFATYAATLEHLGPVAAVASSFRRIMNRSEFLKALLMGLAYIGMQMGITMVGFAIPALAMLVVKSSILEYAISAVLGSIFSAFLTVLLAVYYYDVRTRAEGLDLEVALERLTASS
jgi:hypothetical protein